MNVAAVVASAGLDEEGVVRGGHTDVVGQVEAGGGVGEDRVDRVPHAEDLRCLTAQPSALPAAGAVERVGAARVLEGYGDEVGAVVVAGAGVGALDERADAHGDVLRAARGPGLRGAQGGEHRAERVDGGLVLGGEAAGDVAAAAEHATDHRTVMPS
ncbi:hypothetical protein NGM36_16285 [Streptomyces mutabilis]|uniref:hypothetical protein n=1 Tax=Streptomyces mutabilis TaxID=67332 RepID=UPI0022BA41E7|nr:hypothetical protein [Streptomyces mutabilis]MCZ9351330.1 hypothetical protein [Streptomyces mutabilis]